MIIGNITTYIGQIDAEHYYCTYVIKDEDTIPKLTSPYTNENNLERVLTSESEVAYLNKKNSGGYRIGRSINSFNSIEQIHNELKDKFPNQTIVTYYESQIFKEMLYIKDGVNLGYKFFGDVWMDTPTSCWKDLLPSSDEIKIKCDECGHEYKLEDVSYEVYYDTEKRTLVKFLKKYDLDDDPCCEYFQLVWNVIF